MTRMPLFPRSTLEVKLEEPVAFRRFTYSLAETAIVTGVAIRLYRALVLSRPDGGWVYWGVVWSLGTIFFLGMLTAHLAHYPKRRWLWRAPVFAVVAVAAEMVVSLLLIAVGRERWGSVRAEWGDWPGMAANALLYRGLTVCVWALVLAGAVWIVRRLLR